MPRGEVDHPHWSWSGETTIDWGAQIASRLAWEEDGLLYRQVRKHVQHPSTHRFSSEGRRPLRLIHVQALFGLKRHLQPPPSVPVGKERVLQIYKVWALCQTEALAVWGWESAQGPLVLGDCKAKKYVWRARNEQGLDSETERGVKHQLLEVNPESKLAWEAQRPSTGHLKTEEEDSSPEKGPSRREEGYFDWLRGESKSDWAKHGSVSSERRSVSLEFVWARLKLIRKVEIPWGKSLIRMSHRRKNGSDRRAEAPKRLTERHYLESHCRKRAALKTNASWAFRKLHFWFFLNRKFSRPFRWF